MTAPNPLDRMAALRARMAAPAPVEVAASETPKATHAPEPVSAPVAATEASPSVVTEAVGESAPAAASVSSEADTASATPDSAGSGRRGRPKGSKNAPKTPPVVGNINPPEVLEALSKLAEGVPGVDVAASEELTAPAAETSEARVQRIVELHTEGFKKVEAAIAAREATVCPDADILAGLLSALVGRVPFGVTITIAGQR